MEKLASVVLCTYNGERFLREQLDSLLAQTYRPLEIVISDDGSSDATKDIIEEFSTANPDMVRVLANEARQGLNDNFMNAYLSASGEYIFPCDQDDIWKKDKVEKLVSAIGDRDMVYTDSILVSESGGELNKRRSDLVNMVTESKLIYFIFCNCVAGHSLMFRRSLLDVLYPYDSHIPNDWWITWAATCRNGIRYLDWGSVYYRQHESNISDPLRKASTKKKRDSLAKNRGRIKWLNILKDSKFISSKDREMAEYLSGLYERRFDIMFIDTRMFRFHYQNRDRLYFSLKKSPIKIFRNIVKESLGLRFKMFLKKVF